MIKYLSGDCRDILKTLEAESVQCCVTSPPYWGLRNYGHERQIGLESTFQQYINNLIFVFDEIKRVLKWNGTLWVNIADCYGGSNSGKCEDNKATKKGSSLTTINKHRPSRNVFNKSLIGIPERFAIAMSERGWLRRNTIVWHKPNCMPASVKDRFTNDFEYLYFFTKSQKYFFKQQYEKERNKRCVWSINTRPYKHAHFAVFPHELIKPCILAGSREGDTVLDPFAGSGTTGEVALRYNREAILIELNPDYVKLQDKRTAATQTYFDI